MIELYIIRKEIYNKDMYFMYIIINPLGLKRLCTDSIISVEDRFDYLTDDNRSISSVRKHELIEDLELYDLYRKFENTNELREYFIEEFI